jgi:hypothetical protein
MQDNERAQMIRDIFIHTSKKLLAYLDQESSSWKMSEDISVSDSKKFLKTLPKSGMMLDGKLYELPMLAHHIEEKESSSLPRLNVPTPTASDAHWSQTNAERSGIKGNHNLSLVSWSRRVLGTPTTAASGRSTAFAGTSAPNPHELAKMLLPTPLTSDQVIGTKADEKRQSPQLRAIKYLLSTPLVNASHQSSECRDYGGSLQHDLTCICKKYRIHWIKTIN